MYVRVGEIYHFQYGLTRSKYQKCWRSEKRKKKRRNKTKAGIEMSFLLCLAAKK